MNRSRLEDIRRFVYIRDSWRCKLCGKPATQIAHKIAQTKTWIKKYGEAVIHHPLNMESVCSLACNDACNIGNNPVEREKLVAKIREAIAHESQY